MEISLENVYVDLGALRVNEVSEGGDTFCRDFFHHL